MSWSNSATICGALLLVLMLELCVCSIAAIAAESDDAAGLIEQLIQSEGTPDGAQVLSVVEFLSERSKPVEKRRHRTRRNPSDYASPQDYFRAEAKTLLKEFARNPGSFYTVTQLTDMEILTDDLVAAKRHSFQSIALDPKCHRGWVALAQIYAKSGEQENAVKAMIISYQVDKFPTRDILRGRLRHGPIVEADVILDAYRVALVRIEQFDPPVPVSEDMQFKPDYYGCGGNGDSDLLDAIFRTMSKADTRLWCAQPGALRLGGAPDSPDISYGQLYDHLPLNQTKNLLLVTFWKGTSCSAEDLDRLLRFLKPLNYRRVLIVGLSTFGLYVMHDEVFEPQSLSKQKI